MGRPLGRSPRCSAGHAPHRLSARRQRGHGLLPLRRTARSPIGEGRAGTGRPPSRLRAHRAGGLHPLIVCAHAPVSARPKESSMRQLTSRMPVADGAPPTADPRSSAVFAVTALGAFMAALDLSIVNVAFPDLEASYPHASQASLAWVITAYSIVFGALLVTGGRTGDRIGRRRTFTLGLGVFVAGSFLCGIAPNVPALVASRVLQGAGAAFLVPASVALLIGSYPSERRTQMVALWGGVGALAVATGPSLGATIVSAGGWRWAFFVNIPIGAAIVLLGRRVLIESETDSGAVRFGVAFVQRSLHHPEPVVDPSLFGDRSFVMANVATFVYAAGFFAMLLGNILFLTGVWHYSIMRAGLAVTPGPLVVAIVAGPAGKLAGRVGF